MSPSRTQYFSAYTGLVISFSYGTYPFISWALPEGRKCPFIICASIYCFLKGHHQPSSTIRVRNWPGITNGAIIRHSPTQTLGYLTTLEGLEVQCPGVKDLRNSAPVFLNYGFSPPASHKAFNKVLRESKTKTRHLCLYHPI